MESRYSLILLVATVLTTGSSDSDDTKCQREENASEKVVRLEMQVQQLSKDMRRLEETMISVLDHRREEIDKITHELRQDISNVTDFVGNVQRSFDQNTQQTEYITEIWHSLSGLTQKIQMFATPRIAFSAYKPVDDTPVRGQIIVFSSVFINEGRAYSTTSGKFTAPVNGLYLFTAHLCNKHSMYMIFSIFLDETELGISSSAGTGLSICTSVSVLSMVNIGQQITVRGSLDTNQLIEDPYRRASFMGVLLHT